MSKTLWIENKEYRVDDGVHDYIEGLKEQLDVERIGHRARIRKLEAELAAECVGNLTAESLSDLEAKRDKLKAENEKLKGALSNLRIGYKYRPRKI